MITIETAYTGGLRTEAIHLKSGSILLTDAPLDNHGKGESFSPTDLLAASLGSCMLTIMGIAAEKHGFSIEGAKMNITKVMAENPRRIAEIIINLNFTGDLLSESHRRIIEHISKTCPVALSLHPELKQSITIQYSEL